MNIFKRFYLFFLYHNRKYNTILQHTTIKFSDKLENIDTIALKYQARCSFFKSDFYHAKSVLEILEQKNEMGALESNMYAFICARRNEKEQAISNWCKALELKKNDKMARDALDYIKSRGREIDLAGDEYFDRVRPGPPFLIPYKPIISIVVVTILIFLAYFTAVFILDRIDKWSKSYSPELAKVTLPDYNPNLLTSPKDSYDPFSYDEKEVKAIFEKCKKKIWENKYVEARVLINTLLLSNASEEVKHKVRVLETFLEEPDYAVFENKYTYSDVIENRLLYNNIYIKWKGRIVNHTIHKDKITFDFVIGNEDEGVVEAIIPVVFYKAVIVHNNETIFLVGFLNVIDGKILVDGQHVIRVTE